MCNSLTPSNRNYLDFIETSLITTCQGSQAEEARGTAHQKLGGLSDSGPSLCTVPWQTPLL